jgi:hypothetical protein
MEPHHRAAGTPDGPECGAWYVVTLIMRCMVATEGWVPDIWEQIHIIRAADKTSAYEKALRAGRSEETSYLNRERETVSWEFVGLENLEGPLGGEIRDGTEIRSRCLGEVNPGTLVRTKDELTTFRAEKLAHKTAWEIIWGDEAGENSGADECGPTPME